MEGAAALPLLELPEHLLFHILEQVDRTSLCTFAQCSRQTFCIAAQRGFWEDGWHITVQQGDSLILGIRLCMSRALRIPPQAFGVHNDRKRSMRFPLTVSAYPLRKLLASTRAPEDVASHVAGLIQGQIRRGEKTRGKRLRPCDLLSAARADRAIVRFKLQPRGTVVAILDDLAALGWPERWNAAADQRAQGPQPAQDARTALLMFRSSERPQWEQAIMAEGFADPLAEVHKLAAKYTTGKERHWPLDLPEAAAIPFVKLTVAARHLSTQHSIMLHGNGTATTLEGVCFDIVHRAQRLRSEVRACMTLLGDSAGAGLAQLEALLGSSGELAVRAVSADVDELLMTARKLFQVPSEDAAAVEAHFLQAAIDMVAATSMHSMALRHSMLPTSSHAACSAFTSRAALAAAESTSTRPGLELSPRERLEARLTLEAVRVLEWCFSMLAVA